MALFKKKSQDPFDPTGLEGLSVTEQEKILTKVATREAELLEPKKKKSVSEEAEKRIKQLEKQKGFSRKRASLIEAEERRRQSKRDKAKVPLRKRLTALAPQNLKPGLSPLQRKILARMKVLKMLKDTPPLERARRLNRSSEFMIEMDKIKGVNSLEKARLGGSGLVKNSPVQTAQQKFREKVNNANQQKTIGEKTTELIGGNILPSKLRAPSKLL